MKVILTKDLENLGKANYATCLVRGAPGRPNRVDLVLSERPQNDPRAAKLHHDSPGCRIQTFASSYRPRSRSRSIATGCTAPGTT